MRTTMKFSDLKAGDSFVVVNHDIAYNFKVLAIGLLRDDVYAVEVLHNGKKMTMEVSIGGVNTVIPVSPPPPKWVPNISSRQNDGGDGHTVP